MNSVNNVGLTVADPHGFLFSNLSIFEQCFSRILVCKGQIGLVYSRTRVEFLIFTSCSILSEAGNNCLLLVDAHFAAFARTFDRQF